MRLRNYVKNFYNKWDDFIHALWGVLTAIVYRINIYVSALMFIFFVVYQSLEKESRVQTIEDLLEFLIAFIFTVMYLNIRIV